MNAPCRAMPLLLVHISPPAHLRAVPDDAAADRPVAGRRSLVTPAAFSRELVAVALTLSSAAELAEWITRNLVFVVACDSVVFVDARDIPRLEPDGEQRHLAIQLAARDVQLATIHLFRSRFARPFDEADRRAIAEVESALTLAYAAQEHLDSQMLESPPSSRPLRPRARQTLECLLKGMSEKEAAQELSLSPHTVHQYVKQLYRAYGVRSRPELLARLLTR